MGRRPPVVGLDGCRGGWVAAVLRGGRGPELLQVASLAEVRARVPEAACLAVDMPLGWPRKEQGWRRRADVAVRKRLGRHGSRLFGVPPEAAMKQGDYPAALATCRRLGAPGLSKQVWNLREKILELEVFEAEGGAPPVIEVHPEWAFRVMAVTAPGGQTHLPEAGDSPPPGLAASKKTWTGLRARLDLLAARHLEPPGEIAGGERAGPDDVVDAVACAWVARRWLAGRARALPPDAESGEAAIWA